MGSIFREQGTGKPLLLATHSQTHKEKPIFGSRMICFMNWNFFHINYNLSTRTCWGDFFHAGQILLLNNKSKSCTENMYFTRAINLYCVNKCYCGLCAIKGGFLEAQTALSQQAHRRRRAHLRQAREQRRHKVVCTVNGEATHYYLSSYSCHTVKLNMFYWLIPSSFVPLA